MKSQTQLSLQLQLYYNLMEEDYWPDHKMRANRALPFYSMLQKKFSLFFLYTFISNNCSWCTHKNAASGIAVASDTSVLLGKKTWHFCFAGRQALKFSSLCLH